MNKSILTGVTFAFFSCALLTNCNSPAEKVTNAQNEVTQAKIDLEKANQEYIQDMQDFKSETAQKLLPMNKILQNLNQGLSMRRRKRKLSIRKELQS